MSLRDIKMTSLADKLYGGSQREEKKEKKAAKTEGSLLKRSKKN